MLKRYLALFLFAFCSCSQVGLIPTGNGDGSSVAIPRVIVNCQTAQCRTNSTPRINTVITTSDCDRNDALFGGVRSSVTQSTTCNGTSGCYYEVENWTSADGTINTIPPGIYNICSCINYTRTGVPWQTCNTLGSKLNVNISSVTGLQSITSWADQ